MNNFQSGRYIDHGCYKSFSPSFINRAWEMDDMELIELLSEASHPPACPTSGTRPESDAQGCTADSRGQAGRDATAADWRTEVRAEDAEAVGANLRIRYHSGVSELAPLVWTDFPR